ncbi:DUF2195 family protein [Nitrogeniibacter aestuarii]|uniref:DUF2195 family protein n=1 Tax=Nitrogeniibacter aestuarii TaxID=2815343 RepID=UPI001D10E6B2|nr:DUF2195 family protein [Nitrogeniibacter aestuarii]
MAVRVFKRVFLAGAVLAFNGCAAVAEPVAPVPLIQSWLAECADIAPKGVRVENARVMFDADFVVKQPIGVCGCMSAIAGYHSIVVEGGKENLVQRGHFDLMSSGAKTFDLGPVVKGDASRVVRFMCAGPR